MTVPSAQKWATSWWSSVSLAKQRSSTDVDLTLSTNYFILCSDDFHARSSDELSLTKGDRVELIERDDEFGDGWFLGRHIINKNTGLFPEG